VKAMFIRKESLLVKELKQQIITELEQRVDVDQKLLKEIKKVRTCSELNKFFDKAKIKYEE
jgi:hypothetical protein